MQEVGYCRMASSQEPTPGELLIVNSGEITLHPENLRHFLLADSAGNAAHGAEPFRLPTLIERTPCDGDQTGFFPVGLDGHQVSGHATAHFPQAMHLSRRIRGGPSLIRVASKGQALTQWPKPRQE